MLKRSLFKPVAVGVASLSLVMSVVVMTGCSGCGASKSAFVTNLYRYYPETTSYYVELNTSEANAKRILGTMDKLIQKTNIGGVKAPKKLAEEYPKYFENSLSLGVWNNSDTTTPAEEESPQPSAIQAPPQNNMVMALPVKSGVTFEKIQTGLALQKPITSTLVTKNSKTVAYNVSSPETGSSSVMAIVNNTLLVAEKEAILKEAIELSEDNKNISTHPLVVKNLGNLDAQRQGTWVTLQQPGMLNQITVAGAESKNLMAFMKQMQEVAPISVGSIQINDTKQVIDLKTFTPLDFSKITEANMRKDLENMMSSNQTFSIPATVAQDTIAAASIYGLSKYFDVYMTYFASAADKNSIEQANDQLKMMGLDLRKNIVALFDETSAVSITEMSPVKTDVALLLNSTADTKKAVDQLAALLSQMTQGKVEEQSTNGKTLKTINSPVMPFKIAFSEIQPKVLAIGTLPALQLLPSLSKGPSLESNALYKDLSQGVDPNCYSFIYVNLDAMAKQIPDMAQLKDLGLKGGLAINIAQKNNNMLMGQFRIKWSDAPTSK